MGTKVLVVEEHTSICNIITFSLESAFNFNVLTAQNVERAQAILSDYSDIQLIISDHETGQYDPMEIFRLTQSMSKPIPYIATCENGDSIVLENKRPNACLPKRDIISPLNELVESMFQIDETADADEYTKVSFKTLLQFDGISDDLFIKLKTGRLLKLYSRGDKITDSDFEKYNQRGIYDLYIHRDGYQWILRQIEEKINEIIENPGEKITIAPRENIETPPTKVKGPYEFEEKFIKHLHTTSKKLVKKLKKNKDFAKHLKSMSINREDGRYFKNRIDLVCNISAGLAKELGWGSDASLEKLVYVAHVHDLTLFQDLHLAKIQKIADFNGFKETSAADEEKFKGHMDAVMEIIRKDKASPPEAETIISQHHERPDGSGFPKKLTGARIIPFAAILIVSIDFAQYILDNTKWSMTDYIELRKNELRGGNFTKIFATLTKLSK